LRQQFTQANTLAAYKAHVEAVTLDPNFAKAWVAAASTAAAMASNFVNENELDHWKSLSQAAAEKALALAPSLGAAHAAMALVWERQHLDFPRARAEYDRAIALSPGEADLLARAGLFIVNTGDAKEGLALLQRAIALDQVNPVVYSRLGNAMLALRRYDESTQAARRYLQILPGEPAASAMIGTSQLAQGDAAAAFATCEHLGDGWQVQLCRTMALDRLHRTVEADAEFKAMRAGLGNSAAYQYAQIEAGRGHVAQALDWLDVAYKLKDPGLSNMRVDPFMDPLRKEPRFLALYKTLRFP
jgi:Tfp pilus assembly protein PilF